MDAKIEMENEIQQALNKVSNLCDNSRSAKDWTTETKKTLCELGERLGFHVATGGFKGEFNPEWLYDVIWYRLHKGMLESVNLVVESEWSINWEDIQYDFEKLLVANAQYRLFICQTSLEQFNAFIDYFQQAIDTYQYLKLGDKFLIAILDYNSNEFQFYSLTKG